MEKKQIDFFYSARIHGEMRLRSKDAEEIAKRLTRVFGSNNFKCNVAQISFDKHSSKDAKYSAKITAVIDKVTDLNIASIALASSDRYMPSNNVNILKIPSVQATVSIIKMRILKYSNVLEIAIVPFIDPSTISAEDFESNKIEILNNIRTHTTALFETLSKVDTLNKSEHSQLPGAILNAGLSIPHNNVNIVANSIVTLFEELSFVL